MLLLWCQCHILSLAHADVQINCCCLSDFGVAVARRLLLLVSSQPWRSSAIVEIRPSSTGILHPWCLCSVHVAWFVVLLWSIVRYIVATMAPLAEFPVLRLRMLAEQTVVRVHRRLRLRRSSDFVRTRRSHRGLRIRRRQRTFSVLARFVCWGVLRLHCYAGSAPQQEATRIPPIPRRPPPVPDVERRCPPPPPPESARVVLPDARVVEIEGAVRAASEGVNIEMAAQARSGC